MIQDELTGINYIKPTIKMTHNIKILPQYFIQTALGNKAFEIRKNDRNYQRGDNLLLKEFNGTEYTGAKIEASITFILPGGEYGLNKNYCVLGIRIKNIIKAPEKMLDQIV